VDNPSLYVTNHPGQLSLAIPPWVGAVSLWATGWIPTSSQKVPRVIVIIIIILFV